MKIFENIQGEKGGNKTYTLSSEQIDILVKRKLDFLSGKISSRPWSEIKKEFEIKIKQIRNRNSEIRNSK